MSIAEDKLNSLTPEELDILNSDPQMLADFKAKYVTDQTPGMLKSVALGAMSGIPLAETAVSGIEAATTPQTYEQAHQGLEQQKEVAWQTHPYAYGAGKTAGIVGTGIAAPASIPGAIAVGAASGVDVASKPSEMIADALKGGAMGGVLGTVGEKVISPLVSKIPGLAKGALASLGAKTSTEDIQAYLNNPEAIRNALNKSQIGEKLAGTASELETAAGHLSQRARGTLNPENTVLTAPAAKLPTTTSGLLNAAGNEIPMDLTRQTVSLPDTIKPIFEEAAQKYMNTGVAKTAADETAVNLINDQYDRLVEIAQANGGKIPETDLRDVIDSLQKMAKFNEEGNVGTSLRQKIAGDLQYRLKDILEQANPTYAEKMAPAAEAAQLAGETKSQFSLEPNAEGKLAPTDTTATKIGNVLKEEKPEGAALLERIKNATGQDLRKMLSESQTREAFEAPGAGGGLRALLPALGYGIGRTTGVPFGGIVGAGIGHFAAGAVDGGQIAKNILDMYIGGSKAYASSAVAPLVSKFGPILASAAKQGGTQLAATHFVLATSNPEYQQLVDHAQNNMGGQ